MPPRYITPTPYRIAVSEDSSNINNNNSKSFKKAKMSKMAKSACLKYFSLVAILVAYALVGALIFCALESTTVEPFAVETFETSLQSHRDFFLSQLCNESTNSTLANGTNCYDLAADLLVTYEFLIRNSTEEKKPSWNFAEAIVFCGTIFTTIGKQLSIVG